MNVFVCVCICLHECFTDEEMFHVRPMKADKYYVRVSVDGVPLAMADYCRNQPIRTSCSIIVS